MKVQEIYEAVNELAPFSTQESWDNSGLLVGSPLQEVTGVLLCLDITADAIEQAKDAGCNVLLSHHPVIFTPLHTLPPENPVYQLAAEGMAAICCHTPLDAAEGGINDALAHRIGQRIPFHASELLDFSGIGRLICLEKPVSAGELAETVKAILHCPVVRLYDAGKNIERLGICSGSGSSMLEAIAGRCDALLTGDVKHDRWYKAQELKISLLDCGHYETEIAAAEILQSCLQNAFPTLPVYIRKGGAPFRYV